MAGFHLVTGLASEPSSLDFHICALISSSELPEGDRRSTPITQKKRKPRRVSGLAGVRGRAGGEVQDTPYSQSSRAAAGAVGTLHTGAGSEDGSSPRVPGVEEEPFSNLHKSPYQASKSQELLEFPMSHLLLVTKAVGPLAPTTSQPSGSVLSFSIPLSPRTTRRLLLVDVTHSSASFPDAGCWEPTHSR